MSMPGFYQLSVALSIFLHICLAFQITGATSGINPATGERPARLDINTLSEDPWQFDLFLLALHQIQQTDPSELLSYFQIAGIHGFPQVPWDGVVGSGSYIGFCSHAAVSFPTWHRPYVALWEQVVSSVAQQIAATYPAAVRSQYTAAATTLRLPYWDWAASPTLPVVVTQPQIEVYTPLGAQTIQNPLYSYVFPGNQSLTGIPEGYPLYNMTTTVRWWDAQIQQSNQSQANAVLARNAAHTIAMVYQLFTTVTNYTTFSCVSPGGQYNSVGNNIEAIHNIIHSSVGGYGHMTYPALSAFDPVFWLHHANVDRILAMWQILYPGNYLEPTVNTYGSYYELPGTIDSGSSALAPFHSDAGTTMYTSDTVRNISTLGYAYPGITDWNMTLPQLQAQVRSLVNYLYNPGAFSSDDPPKNSRIRRSNNIEAAFRDITFDMVREMAVNNMKHQWSIQVRAPRHAFNEPFAIYFFMGSPPGDVKSWSTAPNLVGTHVQNLVGRPSSSPSDIAQVLLQGEVALTHVLAAALHRDALHDLTPTSVVPVLSEHLTWRASTPDHRKISMHKISGLTVSVHSREVQPTVERTEFPVYGDIKSHPEVTHWREGGSSMLL